MPNYPDSIYDPRLKENKPGVVYKPEKTTTGFVEDVTKLDDEVIAIETELGTNPKGDYASVKAFLEALVVAVKESFFDRFRNFSDYNPTGYDTTVSGTGSAVTMYGSAAKIQAGPGVDRYARLVQMLDFYNTWLAGKITTIDFCIRSYQQITDQEILIYFTDGVLATSNGIGCKVINADLFFKTADGTAETITDTEVDIETGDKKTRYTIKVIPGTDCKFYLNGVLKVVHTTNLPNTVTHYARPRFEIKAKAATDKIFYIDRTLVEIESY